MKSGLVSFLLDAFFFHLALAILLAIVDESGSEKL
jgi:hypothetical protein